jgi:N4-gp56 family major capsid protein
VTPDADSLTPQDITVSLQEYGVLYGLTNRAVDLYEDDVPAEMKKQCGERIGLIREMIRYGVLKGGTNVYYIGGSSRVAVNNKINLNTLRKVSRNLQANHAARITGVLSMSADFGSTGVEASYVVVAHTDTEADIRDLPNFKNTSEYAQRKTISPYEIGSCENFRFILSPELGPYADAGGTAATNGMFSTTGTSADVYPFIVAGEEAWGQVALRGADALNPTYIPPGDKTKDDPLGQRGYVGASFYMNAVRLNEGWMAVIEAGVSSLS